MTRSCWCLSAPPHPLPTVELLARFTHLTTYGIPPAERAAMSRASRDLPAYYVSAIDLSILRR